MMIQYLGHRLGRAHRCRTPTDVTCMSLVSPILLQSHLSLQKADKKQMETTATTTRKREKKQKNKTKKTMGRVGKQTRITTRQASKQSPAIEASSLFSVRSDIFQSLFSLSQETHRPLNQDQRQQQREGQV